MAGYATETGVSPLLMIMVAVLFSNGYSIQGKMREVDVKAIVLQTISQLCIRPLLGTCYIILY